MRTRNRWVLGLAAILPGCQSRCRRRQSSRLTPRRELIGKAPLQAPGRRPVVCQRRAQDTRPLSSLMAGCWLRGPITRPSYTTLRPVPGAGPATMAQAQSRMDSMPSTCAIQTI
jgi:hypothetical protein